MGVSCLENRGLTALAFSARWAHILAMRNKFDPYDYAVVVKLRADPPSPWKWEIYRAGKRLPIERSTTFFQSWEAANLAGKEALMRLMDKLNA